MHATLATLALLGAALLAGCAGPHARPVPERPALVDVLDYDIDIDVDHLAGRVAGHVDITFRALPDRPARRLEIDALDMSIHDVRDSLGRDLRWEHEDGRLHVTLAAPVAPGEAEVVGIDYEAWPRAGLHFIAPDRTQPGRPWHIWSQGQPHDTPRWIPVVDRLDDTARHSLRVTVDASFTTMAAGTLVDSRVSDRTGRRTDSWRIETAHPVELITLVTGGLAHGELPTSGLPLPIVAEADSLHLAAANFADTQDMLAAFERWTGLDYPWPKYAQSCVRDYTAGGMENVSATTLFHETLHEPEDEPQVRSTDLLAHELFHQWFGDLVGAASWDHLWLNESFATFGEIVYERARAGGASARSMALDHARIGLDAEDGFSRPIVWSGWSDPDQMFDGLSYEGGSARIHLLEALIGEDALRAGCRDYLQRFAHGSAVTADLQGCLERASGIDLQRFFDEWFLGAGYPVFTVIAASAADAPAGRGAVPSRVARIEQTASAGSPRRDFHLPVDLTWSRGGAQRTERIDWEGGTLVFGDGSDAPLDWVCFDSSQLVPGRVHVRQTEAMWRAQLQHADDAVVRRLAAEWFAGDGFVRPDLDEAWAPESASVDALLHAARHDAFHEVRTHALAALAQFGAPDDARLAPAFVALAADLDPRVRQQAVAALADHGDDEVLAVLTAAVDDDNAAVAAEALRSLAARGFPGTFTLAVQLAAATDKPRLDRDIVNVLAALDDERVLAVLLATARFDPAPMARRAAVAALAGRPDPHEVIFRQLCESLNEASFSVRETAARALAAHAPERARLQLQARAAVEGSPTVAASLRSAIDGLRR